MLREGAILSKIVQQIPGPNLKRGLCETIKMSKRSKPFHTESAREDLELRGGPGSMTPFKRKKLLLGGQRESPIVLSLAFSMKD